MREGFRVIIGPMSRTPRQFAVFGFASTHDALDAEALLLDLGIEAVPIPAPKTLGGLCGIALRVEIADEERARAYLGDAGIGVDAAGHMSDV
jgi:hypothetical protein